MQRLVLVMIAAFMIFVGASLPPFAIIAMGCLLGLIALWPRRRPGL